MQNHLILLCILVMIIHIIVIEIDSLSVYKYKMKKVLIIDNFGRASTIIHLKDLLIGFWYDVSIVLIINFHPQFVEDYDLVVLSWWSLYRARNPIFDSLKWRLLQTEKSVIGICLWYEILATIYDTEQDYISMEKVGEIHGNYYPVTYWWQEYSVFRAHKRIVIESNFLLDHFDVLGTSELGIDVIKDTNKPHYGLSFHPELDSEWQSTHGTEILKDIMNQIFN